MTIKMIDILSFIKNSQWPWKFNQLSTSTLDSRNKNNHLGFLYQCKSRIHLIWNNFNLFLTSNISILFNINYMFMHKFRRKIRKITWTPFFDTACPVKFYFIKLLKSVGNIDHIMDYKSENFRYCLHKWRIKQPANLHETCQLNNLFRVWMYIKLLCRNLFKILSVSFKHFVRYFKINALAHN